MKDTWKYISQDHTVHINSCAKTELSSFWSHYIAKIHHRCDISCENNKLLMIFISFNVLSILCDVLLELGFTRFPFQGIYFCNEFFMYHINTRYHKKSFFVVVWMQNVLRFLYRYLNYYIMGRWWQFCIDLTSKYLLNKILVVRFIYYLNKIMKIQLRKSNLPNIKRLICIICVCFYEYSYLLSV